MKSSERVQEPRKSGSGWYEVTFTRHSGGKKMRVTVEREGRAAVEYDVDLPKSLQIELDHRGSCN
ncbi:MAG: hypothetical protein V4684_10425 [Pseudomonadota bacterium]